MLNSNHRYYECYDGCATSVMCSHNELFDDEIMTCKMAELVRII